MTITIKSKTHFVHKYFYYFLILGSRFIQYRKEVFNTDQYRFRFGLVTYLFMNYM